MPLSVVSMRKILSSTLHQAQGKISNLYLPSGGCWSSCGQCGLSIAYTIPPIYDSMIAKIIVHGENRFEALHEDATCLYELEIDGVVTNADFQLDLISDRSVIAGDYDTSFVDGNFPTRISESWRNRVYGIIRSKRKVYPYQS